MCPSEVKAQLCALIQGDKFMHSTSDRRQVCSRSVEKEVQRKEEEEEKEELVVREDFRERVKDALHFARQGRG